MDRIYVFILRNDVWILILASLGLVWYISEYLRSRRLLQRAVFGLERERGSQLRNNAALLILTLTAVILTVFYVNLRIAPTLPAGLLQPPTPTPNPVRTPLSAPPPLAVPTATATPPLAPTITLAAQPGIPPVSVPLTATESVTESVTITAPEATAVVIPTAVVGCNLQITISEPRNGSVVIDAIEFFGTVNTPDFGGYTLEANGPQTNGQWASLLGRVIQQPVSDGLLGSVNLSQWEPGPYIIRLVAFDASQIEAYQCAIQVTLEH